MAGGGAPGALAGFGGGAEVAFEGLDLASWPEIYCELREPVRPEQIFDFFFLDEVQARR
jgi:hypothetical protein